MKITPENDPELCEFLDWYTKTDDCGRKTLAKALAQLLDIYNDDFEHLTEIEEETTL